MKYTVLIERYAQKQIMKLDKKVIPVIKTAIPSLADNPRPYGYKKLKGEDAYRIRVGDYRIIYEIDNDKIIVIIVSVGHRKEIYK
ncbi:MAG: type II toxin-antitoxin system RelE/ParE family toxin [Bacteroidales bacterium]|nr:type II toxin-antitoxin system RelE/ParE family toxin [Bacteroidales bacterium]MDT8373085.1 type II toxin-antitoxin system RelE/ParE family toxin [Bacteroidales bacterium]